ncbi:MAG TPA: MerR family transcriptional regulator [Xanthobacteraceae bacterium]|nr:MerR family transcriptional regulator [Xanthobacteraceae bacterium]
MHPKTKVRGLTIRQVALSLAVSIGTIRNWERLGLALAPERGADGHDVYGRIHIRRLAFLCRAHELGFGPEDLRELVRLAPSEEISCDKAHGIAVRQLGRVRARLRELAEIEATLTRTVTSCATRGEGCCPLLDVLNGVE